MNIKILIVSSDAETSEDISLAFQVGWQAVTLESVDSGSKCMELIKSKNPDLMILDEDLKDISGFEVLKKVRKDYLTPILMLSDAIASNTHMIKGFEFGADDLLKKPINQLELLARAKALIRRSNLKAIDLKE